MSKKRDKIEIIITITDDSDGTVNVNVEGDGGKMPAGAIHAVLQEARDQSGLPIVPLAEFQMAKYFADAFGYPCPVEEGWDALQEKAEEASKAAYIESKMKEIFGTDGREGVLKSILEAMAETDEEEND